MGLSAEEKQYFEEQFDKLIKATKYIQSEDDILMIRKAYDLANEAHANMRRKSGEPYFTHPLAVAFIVAEEIGLGPKSVVGALLHDVVEDTDYTLSDIERMFDNTIANIVDGLTKISDVLDKDSSTQVENFRKMLITMSQDIRVIFIKLADRLHNMRTLDSMPEYKQVKIVSETVYLYAPLAHRLGLYSIKTELEDIALKYQHPLIYREISRKFKETEEERNKYIEEIITPIKNLLESEGISCTIKGRTKSIYSIWNKMQTKNVPFEEIYDLFAIRIVFDHPDDLPDSKARATCYQIMAMITDIYPHHEQRVRDWIKKPKSNGYEALHVTVMGPRGKWVEIQIRSRKMDDIAERGFASHWKYKTRETGEDHSLDLIIANLIELLNSKDGNLMSFLDDLKINLFSSEVYVFTPKGEIKTMPKSATALDLGYDIHTQVGHHAIAAKVNHKLQPLSYVLNSGDQVEILTSEKQYPKREWLDFVRTPKAKSRIKSALKEERRLNIEKGMDMFFKKIRELNLKLDFKQFNELRKKYNVPNKEEFYYKIGVGQILIDDIAKQLEGRKSFFARYWKVTLRKPKTNKEPTKNSMTIETLDNKKITLAQCCNPIPGDEVAGVVNPNNSIIIHKKSCSVLINFASKFGDRIISVKWSVTKKLSFLVKLRIEGVDSMGIVHKITSIISKEANVNMKAINIDTKDELFFGEIQLFIHDVEDLQSLIKQLKKIKGVNNVIRVDNDENDPK
jgi:GTP pyrophosphokinase